MAEIDAVLSYYCEKSYNKYIQEYEQIVLPYDQIVDEKIKHKYAKEKVYRELEQGIQGLEIKLNTVASSRGDYPFTTFTFGVDKSEFGRMVSEVILKVRRNGQGKDGYKKPVLFPKLVFIYDEELHGKGKELEYLFDESILTSSRTMYPDYLSVSGDGYVPEMYKKYNRIVSPMG